MTDIVERLRGSLRGAWPIDETMREAADEIERLRAENHEFREEIVRQAGTLEAAYELILYFTENKAK